MKFKVFNDFHPSGNDGWDNNPAIGFVATRNDTGATMFTSRGECTGGTTTQFLLVVEQVESSAGRIVSGGTTTNITAAGDYTLKWINYQS